MDKNENLIKILHGIRSVSYTHLRKGGNKSYEAGTGHQGLILLGEEEDKNNYMFSRVKLI